MLELGAGVLGLGAKESGPVLKPGAEGRVLGTLVLRKHGSWCLTPVLLRGAEEAWCC